MVQFKHFTALQKMSNFRFSLRANWPWRDKILRANPSAARSIVNQSKPILIIVLINNYFFTRN